MTHETLIRKEEVKRSSDRSFGLVFGCIFFLVAASFISSGKSYFAVISAAAASVLFFGAAAFRPKFLAPLNRAWSAFGLVLHRITSPVVLGLMYFVVLTPLALLMRLGGHDPLRLRAKGDDRTYWVARNPPGPQPKSLERQF